MEQQELLTACSYIASELNRIQTVVGTLATIEKDHHSKLTGYEDRELLDIAVEEQSAARQLGMVRQVCLELSQKLGDVQQAIGGQGQSQGGGAGHGHGASQGPSTGPSQSGQGGRAAREAD